MNEFQYKHLKSSIKARNREIRRLYRVQEAEKAGEHNGTKTYATSHKPYESYKDWKKRIKEESSNEDRFTGDVQDSDGN